MYQHSEHKASEGRVIEYPFIRESRIDRETEPDAAACVDYPVLLNHEIIFLAIFSIAFVVTFVFLLFTLPMRESWILGITMSVVCGLLGTIMSDNLVIQVQAIFGESLKMRINRNHLAKSLKLNRLKETGFDYLLSVSYVMAIVSVIAVSYMYHPVSINVRGIVEYITAFWIFFGINFNNDIAWMIFIPVSSFFVAVLFGAGYFAGKTYLPEHIHSILFFPILYIFKIISAFHEVFKSIVKIVFFIICTWREFFLSIFYLFVTGIITLGRKHYVSNIEVDYMLYVKSGFLILGAVGYLFCVIRSYSG